jgi:folate-binding protein YgfZ
MSKLALLADRRLIQIAGPDWRGFLQGLITQDVEALAVGAVAYGALLTPQGRLLFDMFVWAEEGGAVLDVAAEGREALIARLSMYRLRSKIAISARDGAVFALFPGPSRPVEPMGGEPMGGEPMGGEPMGGEPAGWRADPRLPALGWRAFGETAPPAEAAEPAGLEAYHAYRIALGAPDLVRDDLSDKAYAVEADLDLLNGVDFAKGCFVGQETTSRMKRRGLIKTRICTLSFEGPAPPKGAEVLCADTPEAGAPASGVLRAGEVLSGCDGRALALMRLDRAFGRNLSVDGRPARFAPTDWLLSALTPPVPETI